MIARELIQAVPKSDLHIHLDGSMRVATLIELAREQGVELPSYEIEGLNELVFKPVYRDLPEYLAGFQYTCAVLRSFEAMERAAFELAEDAIEQGVRYVEVRFAPQLLVPPARPGARTQGGGRWSGPCRASARCVARCATGRGHPVRVGDHLLCDAQLHARHGHVL